MKKENEIITEPDNLTDEQLEAVLGGFVNGGKTYTTSVSVKDLTFEELTGKTLGVDAAGSSVYTVDN